jgi:hypothetical protein
MKEKNLLRPEYPLNLFEEEINILLEDVHVRLARLLQYLPLSDAYANHSITRRIVVLRILAAKLELSLTQKETTTDEERNIDRSGGHHSSGRGNLSAKE